MNYIQGFKPERVTLSLPGTQSRDRNCAEGGCVGNTAQVRDCNTGDCAMRNVKKNVVGEPESQVWLQLEV